MPKSIPCGKHICFLGILCATVLFLSYGCQGLKFSSAPKTIEIAGGYVIQDLFVATTTSYQYTTDQVTMNYQIMESPTNMINAYNNGLYDMFIFPSRLPDSMGMNITNGNGSRWSQMPIAAFGIIITLPLSATGQIVLDRETIASIWTGNISQWDDPAIAALNGGSSPFSGNITLVTSHHDTADDEWCTMTGVFGRALSSFDPEGFGKAYEDAGYIMEQTLKNLLGPSEAASRLLVTQYDSGNDRATVALSFKGKASGGVMTYMTMSESSKNGIHIAAMKNRYNTTLYSPTTDTLISSLNDFESYSPTSPVDVDILDGPSADSWPLAGLIFGIMKTETTRDDCSFEDAALNLLAWFQLNDGAISIMEGVNLAPLTNGFRRRTADIISSVTCNSNPAISASIFIGAGSPLSVWSEWASGYDPQGSTLRIKYFQETTVVVQDQVAKYEVDFAGFIRPAIPSNYLNEYPDLRVIPVGIHSFAFGYNIPDIPRTEPQLVISLEILAAIYLNNITMWDDPAITNLNPSLKKYIPHEPIIIVLNKGGNPKYAGGPQGGIPNQITAKTLSGVPGFADVVYNGSAIVYPVESTNRTLLGQKDYVIDYLQNTSYTLSCYVYSSMTVSRVIRYFDIINIDGGKASLSIGSYISAANAFHSFTPYGSLINAPGNNSWPIMVWDFIQLHAGTLPNCRKTRTLLDWIYWTQTSTDALMIAYNEGMVPAGSVPWVSPFFLASIANVNCSETGISAFSLYDCVTFINGSTTNAIMCSGNGHCMKNTNQTTNTVTASCSCNSGWTGPQCQYIASSSGGGISSTNLMIILIVVLLSVAVISILITILVAYIISMVVIRYKRNHMNDDWNISIDFINMEQLIGTGGFGEVHKANWRGTEVAVKVLPTDKMSRESVKGFKDEVRIMTNLRHPNVVLFMAACTKPPKLCIVMEYMALGSLYDLLENELVVHIPFPLKVKIAYQTAKGMHFLHSSNIVHRDLKSLNVLLDTKWNTKVSDFGLTKFSNDIKTDGQQLMGTIQWSAPEILSGESEIDYMQSDVYAFAIIMWEILTRLQPYSGLTPAAVAVGVLRDSMRLPIQKDEVANAYGDNMTPVECILDYINLIETSWDQDPTMRPSFLEIMTRLSNIIDAMRNNSSSGMNTTNTTSTSSNRSSPYSTTTSTNYNMKNPRFYPNKAIAFNSETGSTTSSTSDKNGDEDNNNDNKHINDMMMVMKRHKYRMPSGDNVTIVFTDISNAKILWERVPSPMSKATLMHNDLIRELAMEHNGYESRVSNIISGEGTFCMVFSDPEDAARWCCSLQNRLLELEWPEAILEIPEASIELGHNKDNNTLFRGLRVRMGIHTGYSRIDVDPKTRIGEYRGPASKGALRLVTKAKPGQILISREFANSITKILVKKKKDNMEAQQQQQNGDETSKQKQKMKYDGNTSDVEGEIVYDGQTERIDGIGTITIPVDLESSSKGNIIDKRGHTDYNEDYGDDHYESGATQNIDGIMKRDVFELRPHGLEGRTFPTLSTSYGYGDDDEEYDGDDGIIFSHDDTKKKGDYASKHFGDDGARRRDERARKYVASANMCRWIIPFEKINIKDKDPIGSGSYGIVYKGIWCNVEVAVKRLIKQYLNERRFLEFRAEAAFMSELHHPNIITFIGACLMEPNICIVTEYAPNGSLSNVLSNPSKHKLDFIQRMRMLYGAARGIQYLHNMKPAIVHRDLKSNNLLVDESYNIKIADFGMARIKEDNATMTRCGTPCWTAPEVIRGERYNEKADIYSLGIIMWEVLTRKRPYDGSNFMNVTLKVLEGCRPAIPPDSPPILKELIEKCWHRKPEKRPNIDSIIQQLDRIIGDDEPSV